VPNGVPAHTVALGGRQLTQTVRRGGAGEHERVVFTGRASVCEICVRRCGLICCASAITRHRALVPAFSRAASSRRHSVANRTVVTAIILPCGSVSARHTRVASAGVCRPSGAQPPPRLTPAAADSPESSRFSALVCGRMCSSLVVQVPARRRAAELLRWAALALLYHSNVFIRSSDNQPQIV
jgi:hypothetical protein